MLKVLQIFFAFLALGLLSVSCNKKSEDAVEEIASVVQATPRYLYVASGLCYSGAGNTTYTAATSSNIVFKVSLENGHTLETLMDYNITSESTGSTPVHITDLNDDQLYVLVENATSTGARRIEKISKSGDFTRSTYYQNATALSAALDELFVANDGTMLISKSTAIEKINTTPNRMTIGATTPWVNAPGSTCGTSATKITSVLQSNAGHILFAHANAAQNRIGVIKNTGYSTTTDCLAAQTAPNANSFPTAMLYLSEYNQLLVAYAGNAVTADLNSIYTYDFNETTGALSNATKAYENVSVLYGISAMARDGESGHIYIATANGTSTTVGGYNIEKFVYDPTTKSLGRVGSAPFSTHTYKSKCISSMFVGY